IAIWLAFSVCPHGEHVFSPAFLHADEASQRVALQQVSSPGSGTDNDRNSCVQQRLQTRQTHADIANPVWQSDINGGNVRHKKIREAKMQRPLVYISEQVLNSATRPEASSERV